MNAATPNASRDDERRDDERLARRRTPRRRTLIQHALARARGIAATPDARASRAHVEVKQPSSGAVARVVRVCFCL